MPEGPILTWMDLLEKAWSRLPAGAAFSGLTAAWLHGLDVAGFSPVEATLPYGSGVSQRAGMATRHSKLPDEEVVYLRGWRATSMEVTLTDLCRRLSLTEAVVIADEALHKQLTSLDRLSSWTARNTGRHGIRRLRRVIEVAEPAAESPMESRLRMVLVTRGLPRPKAQVSIHDERGFFAGRPDLYYDSHRLGIEYDGGTHRDRMAEDNRRQNSLLEAGVHLLRFTAADVMGNPARVAAEVSSLLALSGKIRVRSRRSTESSGKIAS